MAGQINLWDAAGLLTIFALAVIGAGTVTVWVIDAAARVIRGRLPHP